MALVKIRGDLQASFRKMPPEVGGVSLILLCARGWVRRFSFIAKYARCEAKSRADFAEGLWVIRSWKKVLDCDRIIKSERRWRRAVHELRNIQSSEPWRYVGMFFMHSRFIDF